MTTGVLRLDKRVPRIASTVAEPVLAHRITIKPELWMSAASGRSVVGDVLRSVATPTPRELSFHRPEPGGMPR